MSGARDGRAFEPTIRAYAAESENGTVELRSPTVGLWRGAPVIGDIVTPGAQLGELEMLGVLHRLIAPTAAHGLVIDVAGERTARRSVDAGAALVRLDPRAAHSSEHTAAAAPDPNAAAGLVFRAASSGRFYARPSPKRPLFVQPGDIIETGHTICLLEVMKTFNRLTFGGPGLPARARILTVRPTDGQDLEVDDIILELQLVD